MAHQADFPCPLSAVPTANLLRPRSFRSVLNPVPPSQLDCLEHLLDSLRIT
jgi:hypothetical protein